MQVYGNVARDVNRDILGRQAEYLAKGFDAATAAARAQADLNLQASGRLGELSNLAYTQGTGGLNVLSGLGAQQQAREQAVLDYPMSAAGKEAALLRGFQIPTSQTQTYKGPMPGAYQKSDLDYILATLAATGALFTPSGKSGQGATPADQILSSVSRIPGIISKIPGVGQLVSGLANLFDTSSSSGSGSPTFDEINAYLNSQMYNYADSGQGFYDYLNSLTPEDFRNIDWGVSTGLEELGAG